ncbi:MAG: hypothetical protein IPH75_12585 [bacterium]|nr:hypothetical protein [bacterium]
MRTTRLLVILLFCALPVQAGTVYLQWTAPGDDGYSGQATKYELRYSLLPITSANWSNATVIPNLPTPKLAGGKEKLELTGFASNTIYYFALRTADERNNWSSVSNNAVKKTCDNCVGQTGNVNGSADDLIDLSDLAVLISFLQGTGTGLQFCMAEANVNGSADGRVDLSDLAYFISYFFGGQAPRTCP